METVSDIARIPTPLEQQRVDLRAFSEDVMAAIKKLPMPTTWLEGERAMRCIGTSDRILVQLHAEPKQPKPVESPINTCTPRELVEQYKFSPEVSAFLKRKYEAMEGVPAEASAEMPFVYCYDDDGVDEAMAATAQTDVDSGAALDAVLDDLDAMMADISEDRTPRPLKSHPPARTGPSDDPTDAYYALSKTLLDGLNGTFCDPIAASP